MIALGLIFIGSAVPDFGFALQTSMIAHGRKLSVAPVDYVTMLLQILAIGLTVKTLTFASVNAFALGGSLGTVLGLYADPVVEGLVSRLTMPKGAS